MSSQEHVEQVAEDEIDREALRTQRGRAALHELQQLGARRRADSMVGSHHKRVKVGKLLRCSDEGNRSCVRDAEVPEA